MIENFSKTELAQERWKPIFGYDGMYEVSDLGRVRSRKSGEWKMLRARKGTFGYLSVMLFKNGKAKNGRIHQLVARYFIENDNIFNTEVNHKDENKQNNIVSNLEWCDRRYNIMYNDLHHRRVTQRDNYKYPKVKELYDPNLNSKQNIELLKANGVECSRGTIVRLRRDLGLARPHNIRNELKDLYDPNLSISDNIELFKTNGIDCSRNTVKRLKRDLGLTKKHIKN